MFIVNSEMTMGFLDDGSKVFSGFFYTSDFSDDENLNLNGIFMLYPAFNSSILREFILENVERRNSLVGEIMSFYPRDFNNADEEVSKFQEMCLGSHLYGLMEKKCFEFGAEMMVTSSSREDYIDFLKRKNFYFVNDYGISVGYKFLK